MYKTGIKHTILFTLLLSVFSVSLHAKNLGVIGEVYPIQEEDFLTFIERQVSTMQKNGEWARIQREAQSRVQQHIDRPTSLTSITKTTIAKSWEYDPSINLPYDLHDQEGHVFAKAGTTVNPLSIVALHTALAFYDADDVNEVQWAKKINKTYAGRVKFVLINGSVSAQEKILHQPIYFDQEGRLTKRFHIEHVPAIVYQKDLHLNISEVLP